VSCEASMPLTEASFTPLLSGAFNDARLSVPAQCAERNARHGVEQRE